MASAHIEEAIEVCKHIHGVPLPVCGQISRNENSITITTEWTQKDVTTMNEVRFRRHDVISSHGDKLNVIKSFPNECSNEVYCLTSPSQELTALVRLDSDKQRIEVWSKDRKLLNIVTDLHGHVYTDRITFGPCFTWSHNSDKLMYIAEKTVEKSSWFDAKNPKGNEHVYEPNWGEMLTDVRNPVIGILDIHTGKISVVNVDDSIACAQPIWCENDEEIVFIGYDRQPFQRGLRCTPNRRSAVYKCDLRTMEMTRLSASGYSVQQPRCTVEGDVLWIQYIEGDLLSQTGTIVKFCSDTSTLVTLIDVEDVTDEFYGIYETILSERCFLTDGRLVFSTQRKFSAPLFTLDIYSSKIAEMTSWQKMADEESNWRILDVDGDCVLAYQSTVNKGPSLFLGTVSDSIVRWTKIVDGEEFQVEYKIQKHFPINEGHEFESMLLRPKLKDNSHLVFFPHGGPHLRTANDFMFPEMHLAVGFVQCGFSVLFVNYRGSTGYGDAFLRSLLGHLGDYDLNDCIQALTETRSQYSFNKISLWSASYGGDLMCQMLADYPDLFTAACTRNPAVNYFIMAFCSDIADWTSVAMLDHYLPDHKFIPNAEQCEILRSRSAFNLLDRIKTPIMFMLGGKDQRVPPCQSLPFYKQLLARGRKAKVVMYEESFHPLLDIVSSSDRFIHMVDWFLTN